MSTVDKPNEGAVGQFGVIQLPPQGAQGVPVSTLPVQFNPSAMASAAHGSTAPRIGAGALGRETPRPVTVQATFNNGNAQGNNPATTYTFMSFPQVPPLKIWMVLRIGVTGPDPFATLAGVSALAFRSSTVPQDSNTEPPTFGDLIAVLGTVPNTAYPSWKSVFTRANERIVLAYKSLANSQVIQASMDVLEFDLVSFLMSLYGE
jgi:hypothetical protein